MTVEISQQNSGLVWQVTLQNRTEQDSGLLIFEISKNWWCDIKSEKVLYCSEFFYLNSNKKLLMWYKKVKKMRMFWCWLVVKNIKKWEKKSTWTVL
jgi:hypothetical protein